MTQAQDRQEQLNNRRGNVGVQALEETRNSVTGGKSPLLLVRVALVMVFMYLVYFSHAMMGEKGLIFLGVLVLAGLLGPAWMWLIQRRRQVEADPQELEQPYEAREASETDS